MTNDINHKPLLEDDKHLLFIMSKYRRKKMDQRFSVTNLE